MTWKVERNCDFVFIFSWNSISNEFVDFLQTKQKLIEERRLYAEIRNKWKVNRKFSHSMPTECRRHLPNGSANQSHKEKSTLCRIII